MPSLSQRAALAEAAFRPVADFYFASRYADRRRIPGIADLTFGNPQEMPLPGIVAAIRERAIPHDKGWFAYKDSEAEPRAFIADRLSQELGAAFAPADIAMTTGAFAAIMVALRLVVDAGDEVIHFEPGWFCYRPMILAADAVPVPLALPPPRFDIDLAALEAAITPRTRLVIVNTPHNPTGRIFSADLLADLGRLLDRASARIGRRIFLLADEPYRRLRFDGRGFTSPAAHYPWTLITYSYGKVLLAPGQRLGYLALWPGMPDEDRKPLADAFFAVQMALGWCFPNAVMQYAVPDLEGLSIDLAAITRRRDRFLAALTGAGYEVLPPEGTFYLWARWPGDPARLWNALADRDVFAIPGSVMATPGWFRLCLTASDAMVDKAIPAFVEVARL